jgi:signal transduction histidine kinase
MVWLLTLVLSQPHFPSTLSLVALLATCIYGEVRSLNVPGYGFVNFAEGIYLGAVLFFGPVFGSALAATVGLVSDTIKKKRWEVGVFNLGWSFCTFCGAGWAARGFRPELGLSSSNLWPLLAGVLAYATIASCLQAACQTYLTEMNIKETIRLNIQGMRLGAPAALCLGLFVDSLLDLAPWAVLLASFPLEIFTAYVRLNQLHKELLATQSQLQASSRQAALGVLTAGIAHEINNPLAAMSTSVHLLGRQPLDEKGQKCLNLLGQGIERCRSITERMLLYSRPPESRPTLCRLVEVLHDSQLFLGNRLRGAIIEVDPAIEGLKPICCDPGALVQVLTNLFSNAADSMGSANVAKIYITAQQTPQQTVVFISDNGQGIPKEIRDKIWEPFFTTKAVGSGTGLGLSISRSLLESNGGAIHLSKSDSSGTEFQLLLKNL